MVGCRNEVFPDFVLCCSVVLRTRGGVGVWVGNKVEVTPQEVEGGSGDEEEGVDDLEAGASAFWIDVDIGECVVWLEGRLRGERTTDCM